MLSNDAGYPHMFQVSLSAVQAFQRCEQRYSYQYRERLRQRVRDVAPQRGIILHEYLSAYYGYIDAGPEMAHTNALHDITDRWSGRVSQAAQAAFLLGEERTAQQYQELMPAVERIATRYHNTRGRDDAERYTVVLNEERIRTQINPHVVSESVIDLVLHERDWPERTFVVEHKSTGNVPPPSVRTRDLQTLLYAEVLHRERGIRIDGVLWNYLSTKEPTIPEPLKTGGLTRRKDIDTTWDIYATAVRDAGYDPAAYADMRERLDGRELTRFFPRYEAVIVADPAVLLRDYEARAVQMDNTVSAWERGYSVPIRTLSHDCDYCPYFRLCEAELTGGDSDDLKRMWFTQPRQEEQVA